MKTSQHIIFAAAIALAMVSCAQKEEFNTEQAPAPSDVRSLPYSFGVTSENSGVKTFIAKDETTGKLLPNWETSDKLAVYDNIVTDAHEFGISEGSASGGDAVFEGEISENTEKIVAVYPYGAASGLVEDKAVVTVPAEQVVDEQNVASGALVTVGEAEREGEMSMTLNNVCGLLAIEITYDNVTKFTVTGADIAGKVQVDPATGEVSEITDGVSTITVTPAGEVFKKGVYYVAVLPGTTPAGEFKVAMFREASLQSEVKTATQEVTIQRNGGFDFKKLDSTLSWALHITNKAELLAWNATTSYKNDVVYLDADIDLAGEEWMPKAFTGTFDGQNHKIYNVVCQSNGKHQTDRYFTAFFATVASGALIKDLVLGSSDGESYDGTSLAKLENTDRASWSYAGGVAARMEGGEIKNVKSFIKVELGENDNKRAKIGGIAGTISSKNSKITDCVNYGDVVNNANTSTAKDDGNRESIGGITSCAEDVAGVVISGCSNYGNIICNNPEAEFVGGIVATPNGPVAANAEGGYAGTNKIYIKNCVNYGNVTLTRAYKPSAGGIVGCLCAATVEGCTNLGTVSSVVASELKAGGIAGKFFKGAACSLINCTNGESGASSTKGTIATSTGTASAFIGGILGNIPAAATGALTVSGCVNYADISTDNPYAGNIGGFGSLWNATGCVVTVSDCDNYGNVSNTASSADAGDNQVGGFVGNFANGSANASKFVNCRNFGNVTTSKARIGSARIGGFCGTGNYIAFESCSNSGDISFSNALAATNAMNLGGIVGYGSNGISYKDCINSGKVSVGTSPSTGDGIAGGIVGYNIGGFIDNCDNSGTICVLNGFKGAARAGGIAGKLKDATIKNNSDNIGTVYSTSENTASIGGILGTMQDTKITIDGSTNKGTVYVKKKAGQNLVGGIMGDGGGFAADVKNCVNEGEVYATQTAYAKQYFTVGGIVGRTRGKSGALHTVTGCINRGTVTVTANTDNQLCNAGGIVGETNTWSKVTGNTNEATGVVTCVNNVAFSKDIRNAYAGGISGGDNEGTVGAAGNDTVTDNVNYANVSAKVTNGATAVGAGGVFGMLQRTGTFTGNKVYGSVQITTPGVQNAGAIIGYYVTAVGKVSAEIQKSVTVNGTSYSDAETAGTLATWLCPTQGANVEATYKD